MLLNTLTSNLEITTPLIFSDIRASPLNVTLTEPFVIASDDSKTNYTANVLVRLRTVGGLVGFGEGSPFTGISGDSQDLLLRDIHRMAPHLTRTSLSVFALEKLGREQMQYPAARAAVEMAFFDILAKRAGKTLTTFLNPKAMHLSFTTDITIPIVGRLRATQLAQNYLKKGFSRIKIKVGDDVGSAVERITTVQEAYRSNNKGDDLEILIDANEGYQSDDAIRLLDLLRQRNIHPKIFEQPVPRYTLSGLARVRQHANPRGTRVYADEAVYTLQDAEALIRAEAADGINLKLMKHGGILEALRIAELARLHGLELMIGGMVETRLAMTASLHLAIALGEMDWLDLDTPLLLKDSIFRGGMDYVGSRMELPFVPLSNGIGVLLQA